MRNFRKTQRDHEQWIADARKLSSTLLGIDVELNDLPETRHVEHAYSGRQLPQCNCTDDGDRMLGITPKEIKGGSYQLRTVCHLCRREGTQSLKWNEGILYRETVIKVFARFFMNEARYGKMSLFGGE